MKMFLTKIARNLLRTNPRLAALAKQRYYSLPLFIRNLLPLEDAQTYTQLQLQPLFRKCFFIKIGANDGVTSDPLHFLIKKYNWDGVMVEPVKPLFDRLVKNYYHRPNILLENCAIAATSGMKTFYYIKANHELPRWADGIGSFSRETVLTHKSLIPNLEEYLVEEKLPCMTLDDVIKKHQISSIDLLHIDAEGYDYEVIKLIDFSSVKPLAILYEIKHLSSDDCDRTSKLLKQQGYNLVDLRGDMLACLW